MSYGRGNGLAHGNGAIAEDRPILHLHLLRQKQSTRLVVMSDLVKFHLVRNRWRKPSAADNAYFTSAQG